MCSIIKTYQIYKRRMSSLGKNISDQKEGEQLQFPAEHLLKERKKKKERIAQIHKNLRRLLQMKPYVF